MKSRLSKNDRREILMALDLAIAREISIVERLVQSDESPGVIRDSIREREKQVARFEKRRRSLRPEQAVSGL